VWTNKTRQCVTIRRFVDWGYQYKAPTTHSHTQIYRISVISKEMTNNYDESDFLLSPVAKARLSTERIQIMGRGFIWNRVAIIIVLSLLCVYALYSQSQISQLSVRLEDVVYRVNTLEVISQQHSQVIERFNSSLTNNDVVDQLNDLQRNLTSTVHALRTELSRTRDEIHTELIDTIHSLNVTVEAAETEISEQVLKVKKDVEQYVVTTQDQFSMENSFMVYQLAGTFTVLSCLISMWHMTAHLRKLHQPDVQRKILAILWMSPIYAITSWFSLVFHSAEGYLAIIKDFYEAYVIYQFLSFCIAVLGKGDRNVVVDLLANHADHLTPPFRLLGCFEVCTGGRCCAAPKYESPRQLADAILLQCQLFAVQFVFFRPVTTTAMVVLQKMEYYGAGDGPTDYRAPQFYITIIQNISIFVAFTGLLKFYHAVDKDLAWCRPFAKFLCIKGVVFMTFWQGLALSVLAQTTDVGGADADEWAKSAQNFLICLEMLLFSIAHFYCFPTEEWEEGYRVKHADGSFGDSIALGDFLSDLKLILKTGHKGKYASSLPAQQASKLSATIPEGDDESEGNQTSDMISVASSSNYVDGCTDIDEVPDVPMNDDDKDKRVIVRALQESLGELADDPDIAEATQRLLDSKVLSPSFFDYDNSKNRVITSNSCETTLHLNVSDSTTELDRRIDMDVDALLAELASPTEQTNLITSSQSAVTSSSWSYTTALRPSIFTTVASIAENEDPRNETN
jgi:Organic solute transporter Ostalpha